MSDAVECGFSDSFGEIVGRYGHYRWWQNAYIRSNISVASRIGYFLNILLLSVEANNDAEGNYIEALTE